MMVLCHFAEEGKPIKRKNITPILRKGGIIGFTMDTILFFHTSQRQAWRRELAGAYRYARTRGWRVQVVEPQEGPPSVTRLAEFWRPVGCIAECSGAGGALLAPRLFKGLPTVFLGSDPATMPKGATCIAPAAKGMGERAAREFLEAGIASFGFVAKFADKFWSRDREKDFAETLALHGYGCRVFGRTKRFANEEARTVALAEWLAAIPKPCGILAENDYAAVEVIDLARRAGNRVPDEIAVIGVDNDTELCENARPALTSVALDFDLAGWRALELLDRLVRDPNAPPLQETYPALGIARRGSTPAGSGVPPRILDALAFIRENACAGISAGDVAARMPGSRRYSEMEFKRATGRSILEEIQRVRFENVELLLRDRYRVIGVIAGLCGWKSENALRTAFLKRYGCSMRQWRRNHVQ